MAKDKKAAKELTIEEKLAQALVPVEEQPYKIPENWCWTTVDKVSRVITGSTPSKKNLEYYGTEFPFFKPADLDAGRHVYKASEYLSEEGKKVSRIIPTKSTVVCCIGSIGKCGYLETEGTTNQQINSAIPKINSLYLYYYMNTDNFINQLWKKASATTIAIVNKAKMETCMFPLAPSGEQQRIVDCIESIFFRLDEAKEKAQAVVDGFELRKSAILHKAFTGELTKQWREKQGLTLKSWKHKKFSEICDVVRGGSPRPAGNPKFYGGSIPFMKVADTTQNNSPFVSSTKHTIKEEGLKKTRMVAPNTLLLTNSGATLGVPAITLIQTTFNDGIAAFLNLKSDNLLFYYYFWMSKTNELRGINKGAAQPNLNTDIIGAIEIDIPKEDEQTQIVMILKYLIGKEEQVKEAAESVIEKIETMKKTVLACAFRGKLGTNDLSEVKAVEVLKQVL